MSDLLSIRRFAAMTGLTQKALRLYGAIAAGQHLLLLHRRHLEVAGDLGDEVGHAMVLTVVEALQQRQHDRLVVGNGHNAHW